MASPGREEAARVAGALVLCALGDDTGAAAVLLAGTDRPVLEQACCDLAWWLTECAEDPAALRAGIAAQLLRHAP